MTFRYYIFGHMLNTAYTTGMR